ncbi:hypothetical protein OEW28_05860 [Defluviimonas sp. WL0002]|uniref:Uncharacterized protein n=1 Tax=Albidovulum marisflavi TaxID=2984159 RepID=A0ABT2ZAK4_9RHOB|nr:hypothetical protein [Defluviimonas sp. WL0002]MCV2868149.1 hypothetical protein [Defluviimonas sp. WL0002]
MNRNLRAVADADDPSAEMPPLSVTLVFAPFEKVLPTATGILRARHGQVALAENVLSTPQTLFAAEQQMTERLRNRTGAWVLAHWPIVLSEPSDAEGITLIEDYGNAWLAAAIARLRPGISVLSLRGGVLGEAEDVHRFTLRRGSRVLRRVESRRHEVDDWQVVASGRAQPFEEALGGDAATHRLDRMALMSLANGMGVDLSRTLDARRVFRSCALIVLDDKNLEETRLPTRVGQSVMETALRQGFGPADDGAAAIGGEALTEAEIGTVEAEAQRAIGRARTVEELRDVLLSVAALSQLGDTGRHRLGSLYSLALARAYRLDLESLTTRRLERDWHDVVAGTEYAVSRDMIESDRAKAQRNQVLRPLVQRHEAICRAAQTPEDLMPILEEITGSARPEVDARFREMALLGMCKRARELDPDDPVTARLAEMLLEWQAAAREPSGCAPKAGERPPRPARRTRLLAAQLLR